MQELWKDIINYEGFYQVSNLGNVKRLTYIRYNQFGAPRIYREHILNPTLNDGYLIVTLYKNGECKRQSVARLVGLHFLPAPENPKMVVAHIDPKNKLDNSVSNIKWNIINKCRAKKSKDVINIIKNTNKIDLLLEDISGIYKIINESNKKFYIGSSVNILKRNKYHLTALRANSHCNKKLQRSYNKYGEGNFKIEIVEECCEDLLLDREQYYIDYLKPELNIANTSSRGGCGKHSEKSKQKISIAQKEIYKNLSEEKKEVRRKNASKGRKGKKLSEAHKKAWIGAASKAKFKPVLQYDANMCLLNTFKSIKEAVELSKYTCVQKALKSGKLTGFNHYWKYK